MSYVMAHAPCDVLKFRLVATSFILAFLYIAKRFLNRLRGYLVQYVLRKIPPVY